MLQSDILSFLPSPILGSITATLAFLNTTLAFLPLFFIAVLKLLVPHRGWRDFCRGILSSIAEGWVAVNGRIGSLTGTQWEVTLPPDLERSGRYLIVANHQSWSDVLVIQRALGRRVPFLTFFLKQELIWVPMLGLAWWALDMPFVKRYSKAYLQKNPGKRGADLSATRASCAKLKGGPLCIVNFAEGTRFRDEKHQAQSSPYRHLLKPRAGGLAFTMNALDGAVHTLLDATLVYDPHRGGLWDLLSGRLKRVQVVIEAIHIPERFLVGDYQEDEEWRAAFQAWLSEMWERKDARMHRLLTPGEKTSASMGPP